MKSVAILEDQKIVVNHIYSQVEHTSFGGVVPEIASRLIWKRSTG